MEAKKRHMKGEGSISYREKEKLYVVRYKSRSAYAHSQREAIDKLNDLKVTANQPKANKILIEKALATWMKSKSLTLKPTSIDPLEQTVNTHLIPSIGGIPCDEFSEADFIQYILEPMCNKSLSFSSVKKAQDAVFAFTRWARLLPGSICLWTPWHPLKGFLKQASF